MPNPTAPSVWTSSFRAPAWARGMTGCLPAGLERIAGPVAAWLSRPARGNEARAQQRDIARVRRLAGQVRHSNAGYAADLEAAAAALEERLAKA